MQVFMEVCVSFAAIAVGLWHVQLLGSFSARCKKDSTAGDKPSGLILYKDASAGIEYVGTVFGGLTQRVLK